MSDIKMGGPQQEYLSQLEMALARAEQAEKDLARYRTELTKEMHRLDAAWGEGRRLRVLLRELRRRSEWRGLVWWVDLCKAHGVDPETLATNDK